MTEPHPDRPSPPPAPSCPTALVFGASGYIGTNLVPRLVREGWRVRGTKHFVPHGQHADVVLVIDERWSLQSVGELPPSRVWADFIFANQPVDIQSLAEISEELMFLVETRFYRRAMRPEMPEVLHAIKQMGLKIGLISNVNSRRQVPVNLKEYGIIDYFHPIVLSSEYGHSKPDPAIFHHAARLI